MVALTSHFSNDGRLNRSAHITVFRSPLGIYFEPLPALRRPWFGLVEWRCAHHRFHRCQREGRS